MITFCLTSCNRLELLKRTLESFFQFTTAKIDRYIIVDDSTVPGCIDEIKELYPQIEIYYNPVRLGMMGNIDVIYSKVTTPYIFHCEDDWEFYESGFIEKSIQLLSAFPKLLTVWLRDASDTNGHPIDANVVEFPTSKIASLLHKQQVNNIQFRRVEFGYMDCFHGYTTNPGLRRLSDVPVDGFAPLIKDAPMGGEHLVSQYYFEQGYFAVVLLPGYVRHIGWGKSTIQLPHLSGTYASDITIVGEKEKELQVIQDI